MQDARAKSIHVQSDGNLRHVRITAFVIAIGCAAILTVALYLTPDPRGFGTHEQLGLPPCLSTKFFHVPCPVCGMTTAFTLMAHARPADAFRTQPAGAIFFMFCLVALAAAVSTALIGDIPRAIHRVAGSRPAVWTFAVILLAGWLYKVVIFVQ